MEPGQPREPADPEALARLQRVQRTVMSVLVVTTVVHLAVGLAIAAAHVDADRRDAQVGLNLVASACMVLGIAAALAIHRRPVWSPWLLLGLLPGAVGLWWVLGR
jgi:PIN domain nuclease of toxin-antitoxin system